jgi:hypothetical protein
VKKIIILISIFLIKCINSNAEILKNPLELSEINFKNIESDWIELKINSAPKTTIIIKDDSKIAEIEPADINKEKFILIHFKSPSAYIKSENEILHIYITKKGLTGTTEQVTIEENGKTIEAVCWQNSNPTESEKKDIKDLIEKKALSQNCINSDSISKNESVAKKNNKWESFAHSTLGEENIFKNSPPKAIIKIQNNTSTEKEVPFSINLDGSDSYDPDGDKLNYKWTFPNKEFNTKNPPSYRFDKSGEYEIKLTVGDEFGKSNSQTLAIKAKPKTAEEESQILLREMQKSQNEKQEKPKQYAENWKTALIAISITCIIIAISTFTKAPFWTSYYK